MTIDARRSPAAFTSTYAALARQVRQEGLMERRLGWYWARIVGIFAALAGLGAVVVVLGNSWFQLIPAALLGLVTAQVGFLGHDAAHGQVFASHHRNAWTARLASGGLAGLSFTWWTLKHDRHHAAPNRDGADPDIAPGPLAFVPTVVEARTGVRRWISRYQGWLFFPLLTLEGINLQYASVRQVLTRGRPVDHRAAEATLVIGRLVIGSALVFRWLPPGKAVAFLAVQSAVFGVLLGCAFAPNHKGMPVIPAGTDLDFLRRQVITSRNVPGGMLTTFMMGGLNYQIEHHLFPRMPRPNLVRAVPLVRAHCLAHDVPYTEAGLLESYGIVIRYLNEIGLGERDPFLCPLASSLGR